MAEGMNLHKDREKARRVNRIMREATLPPLFLRPLARVKAFSMQNTHIETVIEHKQFLRKKYHIRPVGSQTRSPVQGERQRALLGTRVSYNTVGTSKYLSILKQKALSETHELSRCELSLSQPVSPGRHKELDCSEQKDLSRSLQVIEKGKDLRSCSAVRTVANLLKNDVMWCNCAGKVCVCGKASLKSLVAHQPRSPLYSIDDVLLDCQEVTRYTWKVRNSSIRDLSRAISTQKLGTQKFLRRLQLKMRDSG